MLDERLDSSEAFGKGEYLRTAKHMLDVGDATFKLEFANDLGAELGLRGLGTPFRILFQFKRRLTGSCGLFNVRGTISPVI